MSPTGLPKLLMGASTRLALLEPAPNSRRERDDRLAVNLFGNPRRRRRQAQRRDARQLARRPVTTRLKSSSTLAASSPRHAIAPAKTSGPTGCSLYSKRRHDAEVAAAAAQAPEQVGVLLLGARTTRPSAVTSSTDARLSLVQPKRRVR